MNTAKKPIICHESASNTEQDFIVKFHNGPEILISGVVLYSSDHTKIIACPYHNKFYKLTYDFLKKEINTISSSYIFDLAEYPSDIQNRAFLNISLKEQLNPEFNEFELNSFNLFDDCLSDHLSWINNKEHQNGELDATIYFDGEILVTTQHTNTLLLGSECNLEKSAVLLKLNSNADHPEQYGLFCITYYVPSKHINNVETFVMPEPSITYYSFKDIDTAKQRIIELEDEENLFINELISRL